MKKHLCEALLIFLSLFSFSCSKKISEETGGKNTPALTAVNQGLPTVDIVVKRLYDNTAPENCRGDMINVIMRSDQPGVMEVDSHFGLEVPTNFPLNKWLKFSLDPTDPLSASYPGSAINFTKRAAVYFGGFNYEDSQLKLKSLYMKFLSLPKNKGAKVEALIKATFSSGPQIQTKLSVTLGTVEKSGFCTY